MDSITRWAITAIGSGANDDWILQPQNHAKTLPAEARLLRQVLEDPELQSIIRAYKKFDEDANRAQRRYKLQAKGSAIATFLAIVVLPIYFFMPDGAMDVVFVQAALVLVALGLWIAGSKDAFRRWVQARAWAEEARVNLFKAVLKATEKSSHAGDELPLLPLQLEYFRRYLLDSQRSYYSRRGEYFIRAKSGSKRWATILLALSALPILWETHGRVQTLFSEALARLPSKPDLEDVFLALAILAVGAEVLRSTYAEISLEYRNAWRYPKTGEKLDALSKEPLEEARAAALKNDRDAVIDFAESVQQELMAEQHEWIAMSKGADKPV
jgi:hypothetical protein